MHQKAKRVLLRLKEAQKDKRRADRAKKMEELRQKVQEAKEAKQKKASGEIKEPPFMDTLMSFLGGVKIEVRRLHVRYEDDYFQHHRPFSFGFMIDSITLDNSDSDWTFESPASIMITKRQPQ
jgi:hypothetical protein